MLIAIHTPKNACKETQELAKELLSIIPYTFISEEKTDLNIQIIEYNNIRPYKLIIKDLEGEIEFKIVEYLSKKKLNNNLIITEDSPQLIVNNFSTSLGGSVVNWLEKLFPCKIEGRQVVTFQCQNDFIFFRMYRYIFRNDKIDFQNIGPHLCLRLVKLKNKEEEFVVKKYEKKITIL